MGQNMTGWVRLRVQGAADTTVTLRHGGVLDKNGDQSGRTVFLGQQTNASKPHPGHD